jgi:hypothetical protein
MNHTEGGTVQQATMPTARAVNFDASALFWKTLYAVERGHLGAGPAATALGIDPDEFARLRQWADDRCEIMARPKRAG